MSNLQQLFSAYKNDFAHSRKGDERAEWFIYTLLSIILPCASARTSLLLQTLQSIFGFIAMTGRRFYTFMGSPKLPWDHLWKTTRTSIADHLTAGRVLVAIDDCINPKVGKKIYACHRFFDHAAKQNQSKYPWAQNIVMAGLLTKIKNRWASLPLAFRFYQPLKELKNKDIRVGKEQVVFKSKLEQATDMLVEIHNDFDEPIIGVTDSWFGNDGLFGPARKKMGESFNLLARLRCNINVNDLPKTPAAKKRGRSRKYGDLLGKVSDLAPRYRHQARSYLVDLYGQLREIVAYDRIVMLRNLKCQVRVVWVYRKTKWVALFSTDLNLSVNQIVEYYGARWKIEAGFKELKQDIGSSQAQCRNPQAVINHLNFCMMAVTVTWIYAIQLKKAPSRRHAVKGRGHYAFSDVRREFSKAIMSDDFHAFCPYKRKPMLKSIASALLGLAA
jgi:SRSO17 transposase